MAESNPTAPSCKRNWAQSSPTAAAVRSTTSCLSINSEQVSFTPAAFFELEVQVQDCLREAGRCVEQQLCRNANYAAPEQGLHALPSRPKPIAAGLNNPQTIYSTLVPWRTAAFATKFANRANPLFPLMCCWDSKPIWPRPLWPAASDVWLSITSKARCWTRSPARTACTGP